MLYYARSDTHYLLYIYDRVRNDLVAASDSTSTEKNYIERALQRSRELSLSRHEHPGYNEETGEGSRGWYGYVFKNSHLAFDRDQFAVFKALWKWRDDTARKEDESPNYVLSTHSIADIARINPPDAKALHSLLPLSAPLARPRFNQIWEQVKEAKAQGGPSLLHFFTSMAPDSVRKNGRPRVAKQTTKLPDLDGEVTVSRLTRSQLFGDMPISTRWEETRPVSDNQEDTIPFPWQRFVQQGQAEGDAQYDEPTEENAAAEAQPVAVEALVGNGEDQEALDGEFTLKRGQKRKSEAVEDSSSSEEESPEESDEDMQEDNGVISIVDQPRKKSKKERRRERKAQDEGVDEELVKRQEAKKARKTRQQEKKVKRQEEKEKKYDAVPFDYSKASSVMHAKREPGEAEAKGRRKVFDPYSKSADAAVKGARKAPPVRGERSATFRK